METTSEKPWYQDVTVSRGNEIDGEWTLYAKNARLPGSEFNCGTAHDLRYADLFASAPATARERDEALEVLAYVQDQCRQCAAQFDLTRDSWHKATIAAVFRKIADDPKVVAALSRAGG